MPVDMKALAEWLEECKTIRDEIDMVFADDAEAKSAALEKGFRPFFFFDKEKNGGAPVSQPSPFGSEAAPGEVARVLVKDGAEQTYDFREELKNQGFRWSKDKKGWTGEIKSQYFNEFKSEWESKGLDVLRL